MKNKESKISRMQTMDPISLSSVITKRNLTNLFVGSKMIAKAKHAKDVVKKKHEMSDNKI